MSEVERRAADRASSPATDRVRPGRRAVLSLGGILGLTAATGCSLDHGPGRRSQPSRTGPDPDVALVETAVRLLDEAVGRLSGVHSWPVSPAMVASRTLHELHRDRLRGVAPAGARPTPEARPPRRPRTSRAAVYRAEHALIERLAGLAQQARSGELARLFAAMAAATAQDLARWPAA